MHKRAPLTAPATVLTLALPVVLTAALTLASVVVATAPAAAQYLEAFEKRTTVHTLDNGWTFIIVRRDVAPVFSFATIANVGGAQEVPGITGLAHMFEHMAFKGTPNIGTNDYKDEQKALAKLEEAYQTWQKERFKPHPDQEKLGKLWDEFKQLQEEASKFVVPNEFGEIIDREGGVGLNAGTASDMTVYFYSLPANKVELFAYLESERFLHPVFREFYKERDVVQEERRLRTESNPIGRLVEQFITTAFMAHPYRQPVIGYMSDLKSITVTDAKKFFNTYYTPSNLTTAIVGDVDPETLIPLLDRYFGRIPARPDPAPLRTVEPPQVAEKTVVLEDPAQPVYVEAYHKPSGVDPDQPIYDAIDDILSRGRTSRLYRSLVRDQKIAVTVASFSNFPGEKYPNLWAVYAIPARGVSNEEVQTAIRDELERLKTEDVTDAELEKFKTRAKADLVRQLRSNNGIAFQFANYQRLDGDWRELFRYIDKIEQVTKEDIRRVANETLVPTNRTVAMIVTETGKDEDTEEAPEVGEQVKGK
jgi:predicted Zn-dependent peptidase